MVVIAILACGIARAQQDEGRPFTPDDVVQSCPVDLGIAVLKAGQRVL
jgi:hypothetical protein